MQNKLLKLILFSVFLFCSHFSFAEDIKETISYKLAVLHSKDLDPDSALFNQPIEPSRAVISEFHWILEGLKNRCINPENAIADTIVETWKFVKSQGYKATLLDISRQLSQTARNHVLFGDEKVNFRMTTAYWIKQFQNETRTKK